MKDKNTEELYNEVMDSLDGIPIEDVLVVVFNIYSSCMYILNDRQKVIFIEDLQMQLQHLAELHNVKHIDENLLKILPTENTLPL